MRLQDTRDGYLYIMAVIVAFCLFAGTALILPAQVPTATFHYQALLFIFTLSGVVLLSFAGSLISTGLRKLGGTISILFARYRKRLK